MMTTSVESSIVRIRTYDNITVGAGFLVDENHVLTCAHVVAQALGIPPDTSDIPPDNISLDFPLVAPDNLLTAKVVSWLPVQTNESGDVACLELLTESPKDAHPVRLIGSENVWGRQFRAFGFPEGYDNGVWASGILRAKQAAGWIQIEDVKNTGYFIESGFSGTPIWDEQKRGVVGMAVAADTQRDKKTAFMIPTSLLIKALPEINSKTVHICPYRGLFAFLEQDAGFFFGRELFTDRLVETVQRTPIVSVIGPSGSGKSSIVFAGLIPRLRQIPSQNAPPLVGGAGRGGTKGWVITSFTPGSNPFQNLADALESLLKELQNSSETFAVSEQQKEADVQDIIESMLSTQSQSPEAFNAIREKLQNLRQGKPVLQEILELLLGAPLGSQASCLLLIADQFEELYTLCRDQDTRQRFVRELLTLRRFETFARLVITLRADFLSKALSDPYLSQIMTDSAGETTHSAKLFISAMTYQDLKAAIEKPAKKVGLEIEKGLTERILNAITKEPGNLPLLEFALTLLWNYRSDKTLTNAAYKKIGGVERALAVYAESWYTKLTPEEQQQAQRIFVQLVQPGEGTEDTRRAATRSEIGKENWGFVTTTLAASRLVVTTGSANFSLQKSGQDVSFDSAQDRPDSRGTVMLVHEALIREWERLRQWIDTDREFRMWQERLRTAMRQWERSNYDEEELLRKSMLAQADSWLEEKENDLSRLEQEYIRNSYKHLEAEEKRWEELYKEAEEQRKQAEINFIEALDQTAKALFLSHDELGALLAGVKAGKKMKQTDVSSTLKHQTLYNLREIVNSIHEKNRLEGHSASIHAVRFSPNGTIVASGGHDRVIYLWSVFDGSRIRTLRGHAHSIESLDFHPNDQILASGSADTTIRLWNVDDGREIKLLHGHSDDVKSVKFSPDGLLLASGSFDNTIKLWNVADGLEIKTLQGHSNEIRGITFNSAGTLLASASSDHTIKLWDVSDESEIYTLKDHAKRVQCVCFNSDGTMLASGSSDNTIKLWDVKNGSKIMTLYGHSSNIRSVNFSPDGTMLISGGADNTIKFWNVSDGREITTLYGHHGWIRSIDISPDGTTLVSGGWDTVVRLWSVEESSGVSTLYGHAHYVRDVAFSPDGTMLASGSNDKTIRLWNVENPHEVKVLQGHLNDVKCIAFSPDGSMLTSGSADRTVKLWNVSEGCEIDTLHGHARTVRSVAFSPNGKIVASASSDKTIKLWNITDTCELNTLYGHIGPLRSVAFSPNGKILASGGDDRTLNLWDIEKGREIVLRHRDTICRVTFSPDGTILAAGGFDRAITLWHVIEIRKIATLRGHANAIYSLAFSPDGKMLASGSLDSTIKLWSVPDGSEIATLQKHSGYVSGVAFSPDGLILASGSADKTIKLLNVNKVCSLDLDDLLVRACEWLGGYLKTNPNIREEDRCLCDEIVE